jgi:Spy/CpxP family protein refolding chaperone
VKKPAQVVLFLILVAVVAAGSCLLTRVVFPAMHKAEESHAWIHDQLHITAEQEKALEPIEHRYAERRTQLAVAIQDANTELASAILEDRSDSPRVNAAIEKIHAAQGELQMVTMQHVFEMKAVLTPEQADKLLKLTAEALKSETSDNH